MLMQPDVDAELRAIARALRPPDFQSKPREQWDYIDWVGHDRLPDDREMDEAEFLEAMRRAVESVKNQTPEERAEYEQLRALRDQARATWDASCRAEWSRQHGSRESFPNFCRRLEADELRRRGYHWAIE
jgi:hypothetical protein